MAYTDRHPSPTTPRRRPADREQADPPRVASGARRLLTRPWIAPLVVLTIAFLAFSLPPYLRLDPSQARLPAPPGYPWYYPMLVTHIFFGTVALLTACLQVWPWLRQQYPQVHRWNGRIYVFAGALPAAVVVLTITPLGVWGANQQTANTMLGLLWLATTLAGYRAVRRRHFAEHREWMIRSFALAFSIVANRPWSIVCILVFAPEALTADSLVASPALAQAIGVSTWLSWVVNLLVAEWWLHHTRSRRTSRAELVAAHQDGVVRDEQRLRRRRGVSASENRTKV